ncbi:MAG: discoidin domain-containing protein, partial [Clostridia bacterium]
MKKIMSVLLTLSMLLAVVLPMGAASAEENIQIPLTYHNSISAAASSDVSYAIDGDFATKFDTGTVAAALSTAFYTVALDGSYELSTMKIYQDIGHLSGDFKFAYNVVEISDDGINFTPVEGVSITTSGWIKTEETNNVQLARLDYTFPAGTYAKYVKITNNSELTYRAFRISEMFVYGKKYVRPARLSGLEANMGELSPAFDAATTYYTLKINSANLAAPVISATAAEDSEVTSIEQPAESNNYAASVIVGGEGLKETVYKVKVVSPLSATALTLKYHSSVAGKTGTDVNNAIDGEFATFFDAGTLPKMTDGFYIVALDDSYELTNMKLYQDIGHVSGDFTYAYNVVEISD